MRTMKTIAVTFQFKLRSTRIATSFASDGAEQLVVVGAQEGCDVNAVVAELQNIMVCMNPGRVCKH